MICDWLTIHDSLLTPTCEHAGDAVAIDDIVLQIETDKVTVDVRYTTGKPGKLKEMLVKEEDTVAVGQEVASVTEGEEGSEPEKKEVCCLNHHACDYPRQTFEIVILPAVTCTSLPIHMNLSGADTNTFRTFSNGHWGFTFYLQDSADSQKAGTPSQERISPEAKEDKPQPPPKEEKPAPKKETPPPPPKQESKPPPKSAPSKVCCTLWVSKCEEQRVVYISHPQSCTYAPQRCALIQNAFICYKLRCPSRVFLICRSYSSNDFGL